MRLLKPELVSPIVGYLVHEDTPDNGVIVEAAAGWFAKVRMQRAKGVFHDFVDKGMTIEDVANKWDQASDFTESVYPGWDFKTGEKGAIGQGGVGNLVALGLIPKPKL